MNLAETGKTTPGSSGGIDEHAEQGSERLREASEELHEAVGLEDKESS